MRVIETARPTHFCPDSSMVEHAAVNRRVAGSSPAPGVNNKYGYTNANRSPDAASIGV